MIKYNLNFASTENLSSIKGISKESISRIFKERCYSPFLNYNDLYSRVPDLKSSEKKALESNAVIDIPTNLDFESIKYFGSLGDLPNDFKVGNVRDRLTDLKIQKSEPPFNPELIIPDPASDAFNLFGGFSFPSNWYELDFHSLVNQMEVLFIGILAGVDNFNSSSKNEDYYNFQNAIQLALSEAGNMHNCFDPLIDTSASLHASNIKTHIQLASNSLTNMSLQNTSNSLLLQTISMNISIALSINLFLAGIWNTLLKKKKALANFGKGILKKIAAIITIGELLYLLLKYGDHLQICIRNTLAMTPAPVSFWGEVQKCMKSRGVNLGGAFYDAMKLIGIIAIKKLLLHC